MALAILDRHKRSGWVCPGAMIARSMSLVPLGGAVMVGLNVRPYFAARMAMREHLLALQEYTVRWWSSLRINQLRGTPSTALPATGGGVEWGTLNRAMRMTYRVNVVGEPQEGRKLSGMGATRRDPTWYGADYAPPLLH